MGYRRVLVLREVEIEFDKLRKGDIFRMIPASDNDINANPEQYHYADEGVINNPDPSKTSVKCHPVNFVKGYTTFELRRTRIRLEIGERSAYEKDI